MDKPGSGAGSGSKSRSVSPSYGSADKDPDPHQTAPWTRIRICNEVKSWLWIHIEANFQISNTAIFKHILGIY
jgi:hypothetical protein